jgi:flavin reductase
MEVPKTMFRVELDQDFRAAMRRLAATVSVVTIWEGTRSLGMTATAVTSLAADPPSLLVCVNKSASMHDALAGVGRFCVNLLHRDQEGVAKTFADSTRRDERFETGGWLQEEQQPPYLPDAQAVFFCEKIQTVPFGTHNIYIGAVDGVRFRQDVDPLVYVDGRFTQAPC